MLHLNVGGRCIDVRRSTLTLAKGSRLAALFSGRWDKKLRRDAAGRLFVDENPRCFEKIASALMTRKLASSMAIGPPKIEGHQEPYFESVLEHYRLNSFFTGPRLLEDEAANAKLLEHLHSPKSFEVL